MLDATDPAVSPALREVAQRVGLAMLDALRDPRVEAGLPGELARTLRAIAGRPDPATACDATKERVRITRRVDPLEEGGLPELDDDLRTAPAQRHPTPRSMPALDAPPIAPRATRWQRYERGERLWLRGGSESWIGRDRAGGRPMVIDVLPAMPDEARAGILAGAAALARAPHPHLPPLIAHGDEDGACHLVWESLPGEALETLLARDVRLAPIDAVRLAAQVAQALLHAHAVTGRAHGDLRPARLMLAYPRRGDAAGEGERLVVGGLLVPSPRWHDADACAGVAPLYVAPERLRAAREPDLAGDIYALGAILHHLLTGRPPYDGDPESVRLAHLHAPVADPGRWRPDLPHTVRLLVTTALAKSPEGRFASHRGFLVACEKALSTIGPLRRPSVRILRKPMPAVVAVPRSDLVIAPEFADDEPADAAQPRVITTRIVRREDWGGPRTPPVAPIAAAAIPLAIEAEAVDDRALAISFAASIALADGGEAEPPAAAAGDQPRTPSERTTTRLPAIEPPAVPPAERTTALLPAFDAAAALARVPLDRAPATPPRRLVVAFARDGEAAQEAQQRRLLLRSMGLSVGFGFAVGMVAWLALRLLVR